MRIIELEVFSFRNLANQKVTFTSPLTLIVGGNGHGKTSLIEAIYLLAQGKSFRTSRLRELRTWQGQESAENMMWVRGVVETGVGKKELLFKLEDGRREIFLNGNKLETAAEFYGQLRCIEFTPEEVQLVKGPPSLRRQFIDRTLAMLDPSYVENLVNYQRALKSRNSVIRSLLAEQQRAMSIDEARRHLEPWNSILAKYGQAICRRRKNFISDLEKRFEVYYSIFSGNDNRPSGKSLEAGRLLYESHFANPEKVIELLEIENLFSENLANDLRRTRTSIGVHHDEMLVQHRIHGEEKLARTSASQGQARSLSLALKLAAADLVRAQTGEPPVLLLDDVESELDRSRREALFKIIFASGSQVFITSTEFSPLIKSTEIDHSVLAVTEGSFGGQKADISP